MKRLPDITRQRPGLAVLAPAARVAVVTLLLLVPAVAGVAQQAGRIYRVGILNGGTTPNPFVDAFRQNLRALGWVEGRNVTIEARFADGSMDRLPGLAAELIRLDPHVIAVSPAWRC